MKGTLTFNLPEEEQEFETAVHANDLSSVLWEIDNTIRNRLKYSEKPIDTEQEEFLTQIRLMISEVRDKIG